MLMDMGKDLAVRALGEQPHIIGRYNVDAGQILLLHRPRVGRDRVRLLIHVEATAPTRVGTDLVGIHHGFELIPADARPDLAETPRLRYRSRRQRRSWSVRVAVPVLDEADPRRTTTTAGGPASTRAASTRAASTRATSSRATATTARAARATRATARAAACSARTGTTTATTIAVRIGDVFGIGSRCLWRLRVAAVEVRGRARHGHAAATVDLQIREQYVN